MGTVYEAKHNLSQKVVALKVLHPHVARDENSRQRFLREVSAPAQIGHPGICDVYDAGFDTHDGSVFFAMEMLHGETLRGPLERGELSLGDLYRIFDQLLDALGAAHDKGIVHRDLKPENIFLEKLKDDSVRVKIVDFGIVTDLSEEEKNVTQAGTAMGTPEYMSPEQATNARDVTAASDVWAVGVMLYEALSGKPPFSGGSPTAVVVEVITQPHRPLIALAPNAPAALIDLVDRCLSKKPELRPRDAGTMRTELAAIAQGIPVDTLTSPARTPASHTGPMTPPSGGYGPAAVTPMPTPPGSSPQIAPTAVSIATPMPGSAPASAPNVPPRSFAGEPAGQKKGGSGKLLLFGGIAIVALGLLSVLTLGGLFALGVFDDDTGQVRIVSNVMSGEIFVDGTSKGPLTTGRILELPVGSRQLEARVAGAVVAQAAVEVLGGELVDVDLTSPEQRIAGSLGPGDAQSPDQKYVDSYQFEWGPNTTVHIEANSQPVDTYLRVRFPDGTTHENDDSNGTNAGMDFVTTTPGIYEISVTSYSANESGPYELFVRATGL